MLARQRLMWMLLAGVPMACLLAMWLATGGLPYNTDSNESFSAFVQGQNMLKFNPWANAFLPDDATAKHAGAHPFTYTHGPNLPRYFSAAMSLLGLQSLEIQILVSAFIATLLSVWFIAKGFPEPLPGMPGNYGITLGMLIAALFATDFIGTLQFLGNLWRAWHFPLFWGCIWAVRTRPHWIVGFTLFFLVFQLEFLFALFTAATSLVYLLLIYRSKPSTLLKKEHIALFLGAAASVLFFTGQLIAFYGWDGFLFDLKTTYVARNTNSIEWETIRQFYEAKAIMMWPSQPNWDFRFPVFLKASWDAMSLRVSPVLAAIVLISLAGSILMRMANTGALQFSGLRKVRQYFDFSNPVNDSIGPLLWAMLAAYLFLGAAIPGYTLNGYTYRWAPLLVFPVTLAVALCISNVFGLFAHICSLPATKIHLVELDRVKWALTATVLAVWFGVNVNNYLKHPNFLHTAAQVLSTTYKGRSFVSATTFPHMIAHYTGRWAYYTPQVFPGDKKLDQTYNWNGDRNKNVDYETPEYYLCQKLPYYRQVDCEGIANQMVGLGHQVIERNQDYIIMKLNWTLTPSQAN